MAKPKAELDFVERVRMINAFVKTFVAVVIGIIVRPWKHAQHGRSSKSYIGRLVARTLLSSLSLHQQKYLMPDSAAEGIYVGFCKQKSISSVIVSFPSGAQGFWIGNPSAEDIIVYIPGDGYVFAVTKGHFEFCWRLFQEASRQMRTRAAILVVTYSLLPRFTYPVPVEQSIWAMKYILEDMKKDPSRMILAGDSAGATLALVVAAHAIHPFPGIPEYISIESVRFRGLLLLSAWADFRMDMYPSCSAHKTYDLAKIGTLLTWSRNYLSSSSLSVWNAPCVADSSWWKDLPTDSTLLTAGSVECMRDVVIQLGSIMQKTLPEVQVVIGTNECHVDPVASINFGELEKECETAVAIKEWVVERMR